MKVSVLLLALAASAGCKEEVAPPPADPCVEAGELYVIHARQAGQAAFDTIEDPNRRSDEEEKLEEELRAAMQKFPAACAAIGGDTLRRCLRLLRQSAKEASARADFANDTECKAAGDRLYSALYGAPPPAR